jgi:hypothetical protein
VTIGGQVHATATLAGGHEAGGEIEFALYGPNDESCTGTPVFTDSATVADPVTSYDSGAFTPTKVGTYHWVASYSGDADNAATASECADPAAAVTVEPAPQVPVTPEVHVTPAAQGTAQVPPATPVTPASSSAVVIHHSPNSAHKPNPTGGPRYTFTFGAGAPEVTYYCRLDDGQFKACSAKVVFRNLSKGRHVFKVKSIDAAGFESTVEAVTFMVGKPKS